MIDIKLIREFPDKVKENLKKKGVDAIVIDKILELDKEYRAVLSLIEGYKAEQNSVSEEIPTTADNEERNRKINSLQDIKTQIKSEEPRMEKLSQELRNTISSLPNIPAEGALFGKGEEDNKILRDFGEKPVFDFLVKDHLEIGEGLDLIDAKQASLVSGSRFYYLKNEAVLLEFAIAQFALNHLIKNGFNPVIPPVMIKPDVYMKMGRLLGGQEEERYFLKNDNLFLVGSAEHTIGPLHMDYVFKEEDLPKRYAGFSSCFRREAGSHGKDVKGILRSHQFDKIEMFSFSRPEKSDEEHKFLLSMQEHMMQELKLPYQVIEVCTGDMGWTDAKQYDIETWIPSQQKYRETHSCSNTTDFQARGINAKYKNKDTGKNEYVHMLNATGFAIGRILIAILENYQQKDGSVLIPECLQRYMGDKIKISNF